MSVPIFAHDASNRLVASYTRSQLRQATQPPRELKPDISLSIVPDLPPPIRGDLEKIYTYNALQSHSGKWEAQQHKVQARDTDALLRAFLLQQIDNENARRAQIEADSEMPYAGVVRDMLKKKQQVDNTLAPVEQARERIAEATARREEAAAIKAEMSARKAQEDLLRREERIQRSAEKKHAKAMEAPRSLEDLMADSASPAGKSSSKQKGIQAYLSAAKETPGEKAPEKRSIPKVGGKATDSVAPLVERALPGASGAAGGAGASTPSVTRSGAAFVKRF